MSTGPRMPLDWARGAADCLMRCWGMAGPEHPPEHPPVCLVVGSVRRCKPTVGDIEIVAPLPASGARDTLFDAMDATMGTDGLFGAGTVPVARPLEGFRRGFLECSVMADVTDSGSGHCHQIKVSIYRCTPENRGWITIMRTGPRDFGMWFLGQWKRAHGIPTGDERHRASIDGHLVDDRGQVVPVRNENEAFRLADLAWISPDRRDAVMEHRKSVASGRMR